MGLPLITTAVQANNCSDWLSHCNAECCRLFTLVINDFVERELNIGDVVVVKKILTRDQELYYKLHGARYVHGVLSVTLNDFEYERETHSLHIKDTCKGLTTDLKCKYHGTRGQPKICAYPNSNDKGPRSITITPNCKYN